MTSTGPDAVEPPDWLVEVLHVTWGFARREHERYVLTPAHAATALAMVPTEVLAAARINHQPTTQELAAAAEFRWHYREEATDPGGSR